MRVAGLVSDRLSVCLSVSLSVCLPEVVGWFWMVRDAVAAVWQPAAAAAEWLTQQIMARRGGDGDGDGGVLPSLLSFESRSISIFVGYN